MSPVKLKAMSFFVVHLPYWRDRTIYAEKMTISDSGRLEFWDGGCLLAVFAGGQWISAEEA